MSMFPDLVSRGISTYPKLNLNYWAIHKNASSTLKVHFTMLENNLGMFDVNVYDRLDPKAKLRMENRYSDDVGMNYINVFEALSNGRVNFMVTRNPYTRAMSTYKMFYKDNWWKTKAIWRKWFGDNLTLVEFYNIVYLEELWDNYDPVFSPQSHFLATSKENYKIVGLEDMIKNWPLDCSAPRIKVNYTSWNQKEMDEHFTKEAYNIINGIYYEDFDIFNYEMIR